MDAATPPPSSQTTNSLPSPYAGMPDATEENLVKMRNYAAIMINKDGQYSLDEQIAARHGMRSLSTNGLLKGMGEEDTALRQAANRSDFMERTRELGQQTVAASKRGDTGAERLQSRLDFFDSLSASDQKLIANSQNNFGPNGQAAPASVEQWRGVMEGHLMIQTALQEARESGQLESGERPTDPYLSEVVRLAEALQRLGPDDWLHQIRSLFGTQSPTKDRIDLSPSAKGFMPSEAAGQPITALAKQAISPRIDQKV
ncbi:hypothetical protein FKB34_16415 [Glycocaulis profundi]|nr:hypothetical protein FKB34_16415 [Glycocaulis profundi]